MAAFNVWDVWREEEPDATPIEAVDAEQAAERFVARDTSYINDGSEAVDVAVRDPSTNELVHYTVTIEHVPTFKAERQRKT